MIMMKGVFPVRPGQWKQALALIGTLAKNSRMHPDCLSFESYSRTDAPATLVIWQQWGNVVTFQKHLSSSVMNAFLDQLAPLLSGPAETRTFEVDSDHWPVEAVVADDSDFTIATDVIIH